MKTVFALMTLLACSTPALAQTPPKNENQLTPTVRLYTPKNMSVDRARRVAIFVNSVMGNGFHVEWDDVPHALVIRVSMPGDLDAAEAMVKRFDVPEQPDPAAFFGQADCTLYIVRAATAPPGNRVEPSTPIPPELQSAIDEMKQQFAYDHYALWDVETIHGSSGDYQGILPTSRSGSTYVYSLAYKGAYYRTKEKSTTFGELQFSVKMPTAEFKDGIESHINTPATIADGQKLVLGKIRLLPNDAADVFLVLAAKPH